MEGIETRLYHWSYKLLPRIHIFSAKTMLRDDVIFAKIPRLKFGIKMCDKKYFPNILLCPVILQIFTSERPSYLL